MTADLFAYDGLGTIEAQEKSGRIEQITFTDIEFNRRKIARRRFVLALPFDGMDALGTAIKNPESELAMAARKAMERVYDRIVYEALFSSVLTGRDFDTTVTAANDGVLTVDATAGLTYEKLLEICQNYIDNEVGNDVPTRKVLAISGDEHTALMQESELTSGDYSRQFVVDKGEITSAVGLDVIRFGANVNSPILSVSSGTRNCAAMAQDGVCVGISKDVGIKIQERPDYVDVKQVVVEFVLGAVRTEGILVQKVQTTD